MPTTLTSAGVIVVQQLGAGGTGIAPSGLGTLVAEGGKPGGRFPEAVAIVNGRAQVFIFAEEATGPSTTLVITGGGIVALPQQKGGQAATLVTGGGIVTTVRQKGAKNNVTVTGGGVVPSVRQKGALRSTVETGGGVVSLPEAKGGQTLISVTGGGVVTLVGQASSGGPSASGTLTVTGGGVIAIASQKGGLVTVFATGGGTIVIAIGVPPAAAIVAPAVDPGGAGPRRARQSNLDDWTLPMDDERVLEIYLLRGISR